MGFFSEAFDELLSPPRLDIAVKEHMIPTPSLESGDEHLVHPEPLAEDHRLGLGILEGLVQECHQFVGLGAMVGPLVEQVSAVARHAHVLQGDHQTPLINLGQETVSPPLCYKPADGLAVLFMMLDLLRRHRNEKLLFQPLRELVKNLGLAPAQENRRQCLADAVEVSVPNDPADFVHDLVTVEEPECGAEPMLVDELHDGGQLLESILDWRASEDDGVGRV